MMKTVEQLAIECGFSIHPIFKTILTRGSDGTWLNASPMLTALCEAYYQERLANEPVRVYDLLVAKGIDPNKADFKEILELIVKPKEK